MLCRLYVPLCQCVEITGASGPLCWHFPTPQASNRLVYQLSSVFALLAQGKISPDLLLPPGVYLSVPRAIAAWHVSLCTRQVTCARCEVHGVLQQCPWLLRRAIAIHLRPRRRRPESFTCCCLGALCGLCAGMCRELGRCRCEPQAARSPRPRPAPGRRRRRSSWCATGACPAGWASTSRGAGGRCDVSQGLPWVGR